MFEIIPFERRRNQVANWDPFREFDEMERRFWGDRGMQSAFRTDITDTGDAYKLEAELPGFNKEDIKIDIEDGRLTISAEHSSDEKNEKATYITYEGIEKAKEDADRLTREALDCLDTLCPDEADAQQEAAFLRELFLYLTKRDH